MIPRILASLVLSALGSQAGEQRSPSPPLPSLFLHGDTRACHGSLKLNRRHLLWRSSFSACDSHFRVASEQDGLWTLELTGRTGPGISGCSLKAVTLQRSGPASAYAVWQVAGYTSLPASYTEPPTPAIACELQSDNPAPRPEHRSAKQ